VDLAAFQALLGPEGQRLLAHAEALLEQSQGEQAALAVASRLRRSHPPELVAAAVTQAALRQHARAKFGADAAAMYFTGPGLEQASDAAVAGLRARRYAQLNPVADLCCGIGGDLLALARTGRPGRQLAGVDRDPLAVAVARANVAALGLDDQVRVELADVESYDLSAYDGVFCDPSRRTLRGRVFHPAAYSPAWPWVVTLLSGDAGVKLAPGITHDIVPAGVEAEWVSVRGDVKEAALWSGRLATGATRRATVLPAGDTLVADGSLGVPAVRAVGRFLYEPDGAAIRAHLVAEVAALVGGWLIDPAIAYVSADAWVPTPFARAYQVTDVMPFGLKRLHAALRSRGVGRVTVKKRGSAVLPEQLQRELRLTGEEEATVVLTRCAGAPVALLVDPVATR
jgi:SAM-dependent methyltransferase